MTQHRNRTKRGTAGEGWRVRIPTLSWRSLDRKSGSLQPPKIKERFAGGVGTTQTDVKALSRCLYVAVVAARPSSAIPAFITANGLMHANTKTCVLVSTFVLQPHGINPQRYTFRKWTPSACAPLHAPWLHFDFWLSEECRANAVFVPPTAVVAFCSAHGLMVVLTRTPSTLSWAQPFWPYSAGVGASPTLYTVSALFPPADRHVRPRRRTSATVTRSSACECLTNSSVCWTRWRPTQRPRRRGQLVGQHVASQQFSQTTLSLDTRTAWASEAAEATDWLDVRCKRNARMRHSDTRLKLGVQLPPTETLEPTANLSGVALAFLCAAVVVVRHARDALGAEALLFQETGNETGVVCAFIWWQVQLCTNTKRLSCPLRFR